MFTAGGDLGGMHEGSEGPAQAGVPREAWESRLLVPKVCAHHGTKTTGGLTSGKG